MNQSLDVLAARFCERHNGSRILLETLTLTLTRQPRPLALALTLTLTR